ncbi:specifically androgen-regulated gene protein [Heterodontus francisci]|uniref:specifically androgen-regulated gene protein n=1 Tax=Heterodontus francisci TaxID=7792 RepID=UPI00355B8D20
MPISETWAGESPMDSIASGSIVGSCNSVTSSSSTFSDDYLSAEERECLMFLEETIDSLDIEDSSGVSTDELEQTEKSTKSGNMLEKSILLHPELAQGENPEPDGKIPWAVSMNSNKDRTDSASPQMVRAKSGANTLPKYNPKPSNESKSTLSSRLSESSRGPIFSGDPRQRSYITTVQHHLVESKDEKTKLGPPTAPKPRKLPSNIILKSFHKSDGPMVSSTDSQNSFKITKGTPRSDGSNLSRDNSTEGEVQQIRMEALTKLGLLSEPDGQKNTSASTQSLKRESVSISQTVPTGDEIKTNQPEMTVRDNKPSSLKHPSIGIHPPLNRSVASDVDHGMNDTANKPANVIVGNVNKAQWLLGFTKSSSLKRFNTAGENIPPTESPGSALNPGMSNTIPIARRSANVSEGQMKNIKTPQWQLGATKTSSLKRFGTASDNNQPTLYSDIAQNTSVATDAVPGLFRPVRPRPLSICSETDLSVRHGYTLQAVSSDKPSRKPFPITINHISAKFQRSPPKGLNVQVTPQGPTSKDHRDALRKLGLLKE